MPKEGPVADTVLVRENSMRTVGKECFILEESNGMQWNSPFRARNTLQVKKGIFRLKDCVADMPKAL